MADVHHGIVQSGHVEPGEDVRRPGMFLTVKEAVQAIVWLGLVSLAFVGICLGTLYWVISSHLS